MVIEKHLNASLIQIERMNNNLIALTHESLTVFSFTKVINQTKCLFPQDKITIIKYDESNLKYFYVQGETDIYQYRISHH
jgi:hypothetical protein